MHSRTKAAIVGPAGVGFWVPSGRVTVRRAVFEGVEIDEGDELEVRVESAVGATRTVAGVEARVVHVVDYEDGELVEDTEDYYAQDAAGVVYYLGESVDEYEDGEVSGHGGAWLAGTDGALAGVFMPARPQVGDDFEQERAPGVAEDRSTVVAVGATVTVPAGTFGGCLETEDLDPIDGVTERKWYCPDVGLVKESFAEGGTRCSSRPVARRYANATIDTSSVR